MKRLVVGWLVACGSGSPPAKAPEHPPDPPVVAADVGAVDLEAKELELSRVAGETTIVPNDLDRMNLPLGATAAGNFQVCLDTTGKPTSVAVVNTTGIANFDKKIVSRMRLWAFKPIIVDGNAVKVCSLVTIAFRQDKPIQVERGN